MKKVVSTIALFIFSFPAFCATTLDLPYIIKYQKMGEHGYCFVSRTKDDLSKINEPIITNSANTINSTNLTTSYESYLLYISIFIIIILLIVDIILRLNTKSN